MKILFDNGTSKPIARSLIRHEVTYAGRIGWHQLQNGELIEKAEEAGYEVLLSTDKISGTSRIFLTAKSCLCFSVIRNGRWSGISTGSRQPLRPQRLAATSR